MDLRQTKEFSRYLKSRGWLIEKVNQTYVFIRKIPLTPFSIIKVQRTKSIPFKAIERLAKKYRAFQVNLEPLQFNKELKKQGYRLSHSAFLPTKTLQLNLNQSGKKLLKQMKKDARYSLRKAKGLKLIEVKNLTGFHQSWKRTRLWSPSLKNLQALKKAFGKKALFLGINWPPIAGTIILIANKTAFYYYAFTNKEGRKKLAQYFLVWEAIKLAKKKSCQIFDFEGIEDQRFPNKAWRGFSHFKKSFGGEEIEYPDCFVRYRFPF